MAVGDLRSRLAAAWEWLRGLSPAWAALLILVVSGGLALAGKELYDTYYYVQHENEFCLSCHLMQGPYQKFQKSAHRGLSCKACHQPTLLQRGRMGLAQILEQPEEIREHADVPNERCASCHIEGSPKKWKHIEATAGHRVHLQSDSLQGLQCVECHSTSLHEFAPTRQTCGQAGCHEETRVRLGGMGELTVHCVACHEFTRPTRTAAAEAGEAPAADTVPAGLLRPRREECLGCHAMRVMLADFPRADPHEARCAACHNPHEQETPAEAVTSCYQGGCHADLDTVNYFHHRLEPAVVRECTRCHSAHDFEVQEQDCRSCHEEIFRGGRTSARRSEGGAASSGSGPRVPPPADRHPVLPSRAGSGGPAPPRLGGPAPGADPASAWRRPAGGASRAAQDTAPFTHADHEQLDCLTCHRTGSPTVQRERGWCADCHHRRSRGRTCTGCHQESELRDRRFGVGRTLALSVGDTGSRELEFRHPPHDTLSCTTCHEGRPRLSAAQVECAGCHEEHHAEDNSCVACHAQAPSDAHPVEAHLTCSGSGCHDPAPFPAAPRNREVCVACHQSQAEHMTGRECARCHVLPEARRDEAATGAAAGAAGVWAGRGGGR